MKKFLLILSGLVIGFGLQAWKNPFASKTPATPVQPTASSMGYCLPGQNVYTPTPVQARYTSPVITSDSFDWRKGLSAKQINKVNYRAERFAKSKGKVWASADDQIRAARELGFVSQPRAGRLQTGYRSAYRQPMGYSRGYSRGMYSGGYGYAR